MTKGFFDLCHEIRRRDKGLFLDLKLSDIATTNIRTLENVKRSIRPHYVTVRTHIEITSLQFYTHLEEMGIVYVPYLTSDPEPKIAKNHEVAFCTGVVCNNDLAVRYKEKFPQLLTFVPGVRPFLGDTHEHKSFVTRPNKHVDYYIIGRPITRSSMHPREAFLKAAEILEIDTSRETIVWDEL